MTSEIVVSSINLNKAINHSKNKDAGNSEPKNLLPCLERLITLISVLKHSKVVQLEGRPKLYLPP